MFAPVVYTYGVVNNIIDATYGVYVKTMVPLLLSLFVILKVLMSIYNSRRGFTIVELLIVVVVIAILAAITLVAYNNIVNRANEASLKADLNSAAKALATDKTISTTETYPTSLTSANNGTGLKASPGASYQYRVDNSSNPKTYCLTVTKGALSFHVDHTGLIAANGCAGHDSNGVAAITNYHPDPTILGGYTFSGTGALTPTSPTTGGPIGNGRFLRTTNASTGGTTASQCATQVILDSRLTAAEQYTFSAYGRISWAGSLGVSMLPMNEDGDPIGSRIVSPPAAATAGTWQRVSHSVALPTGTIGIDFCVEATNTFVNRPAPGSTFDIANLMATKGSTLATYADGNSPGWAWNAPKIPSTPQYRTSSGIPLP